VPPAPGGVDWNEPNAQRFKAAMDDDFNTALAISVLFDLVSQVFGDKKSEDARQLKALGGVLGLLQREPKEFLRGGNHTLMVEPGSIRFVGRDVELRIGLSDERIEQLIAERKVAKQSKNFAEADRIRSELLAKGVVLEDKPGGKTDWRRQ
jgi:cysteinyl-tRNA synthetase